MINERIRSIVQLTVNMLEAGVHRMQYLHSAGCWKNIRKKRKRIHMAFIYLEKACDRVPHQLIWYTLWDHGVSKELIKLVQLLYRDATSKIRCTAEEFGDFPLQIVHHGSARSPLLFNIVLYKITRDLQTPAPRTVLYADDNVLSAHQKMPFRIE